MKTYKVEMSERRYFMVEVEAENDVQANLKALGGEWSWEEDDFRRDHDFTAGLKVEGLSEKSNT